MLPLQLTSETPTDMGKRNKRVFSDLRDVLTEELQECTIDRHTNTKHFQPLLLFTKFIKLFPCTSKNIKTNTIKIDVFIDMSYFD